MTEPTREPESWAVPAAPDADGHGPESDVRADGPEADVPETGVAYRGADPLPWIKRAPSRRLYNVLLAVPFLCVGASVGTIAVAGGLFRHLGMVVAFAVLFAWVRAGLAITKAKHTQWLTIMFGLVIVFLACGYLSNFA